mmetsp:Transcript_30402/g.70063  ORF Transcript_30402/g.70063 Transcript_30402/m.70063 type:complete len:219 (-) Transcript_30402:1236-1892(-)
MMTFSSCGFSCTGCCSLSCCSFWMALISVWQSFLYFLVSCFLGGVNVFSRGELPVPPKIVSIHSNVSSQQVVVIANLLVALAAANGCSSVVLAGGIAHLLVACFAMFAYFDAVLVGATVSWRVASFPVCPPATRLSSPTNRQSFLIWNHPNLVWSASFPAAAVKKLKAGVPCFPCCCSKRWREHPFPHSRCCCCYRWQSPTTSMRWSLSQSTQPKISS